MTKNNGLGRLCTNRYKDHLKTRSPALQADSLPAEQQEKPKNTGVGVGSVSFFQWIFPIEELNQGLLHYRQILYHLSHQGSPYVNLYLSIYLSICLSIYLSVSLSVLLSIYPHLYLTGEKGDYTKPDC